MRIGLLAIELGAGRQKVDDVIDPKAGIILTKKIGDKVEANETLAFIHTDREDVLDRASRELASCVTVGDSLVPARSGILASIDTAGVKPWAPLPSY